MSLQCQHQHTSRNQCDFNTDAVLLHQFLGFTVKWLIFYSYIACIFRNAHILEVEILQVLPDIVQCGSWEYIKSQTHNRRWLPHQIYSIVTSPVFFKRYLFRLCVQKSSMYLQPTNLFNFFENIARNRLYLVILLTKKPKCPYREDMMDTTP
jgi:hypothetical protein